MVSDPKEYFVGVLREWAYLLDELERLRNDLIAMGVRVLCCDSFGVYPSPGEAPTWSKFKRKWVTLWNVLGRK